MYRKILIAADPEGLASSAAPAVAALADPAEAEVRVMTIQGRGGAGAEEAVERVQKHLVEELEARHLTAHTTRWTADHGSVPDAIAAAARAFEADLIVLGSHRHGDVAAFFVGSVGHALAARVATPILVVSPGPERPGLGVSRVLVAVDGGDLSHQAVVAAASLAGPGAEVTALYVDSPPGGLGAFGAYVDPSPDEEAGAKALDDAMDVLQSAGVKGVTHRVYSLDGTGIAIARAADEVEADLIVLGSRRPGNVEALLIGSVAHQVIAHTRRPVLVAAVPADA